MNSYLNDRRAIERLKKEYILYNDLIIGLDFDNTIFDYHKEGLGLQPVIDLLRRCSDIGLTMCLHTLCLNEKTSMTHGDKDIYCLELGIEVNYINISPVLSDQPNDVPMKPFYSILLDDRAGLSASYNILKTTLDELGL